MSSTLKNLLTILALATIAFVAYYLYTQQSSTVLSVNTTEAQKQDMLANTQVFIKHSAELNKIGSIKTSLFNDPRFSNLRSFSRPLAEVSVGRSDPFAEIGSGTILNSSD
jgi:hypothetical protein